MCCLIDGSPVEDQRGRYKNYTGPNPFQTGMMGAPCIDCPKSCCWFTGQFIPITCGCTQYALRSKALDGDMSRYMCCQGYFNCCGFKAGSCGEQSCPEFCLFLESCCCNSMAISATRSMVIEQYQLHMDPCDYRLIRINNCLQCLACLCNIAAMAIPELREIARIIDHIADLFYHTVSGCMTAQVAHEINYQKSLGGGGPVHHSVENFAPKGQPGYPQPAYAPQPSYAPQPGYAPQPVYAVQPGYAPQPAYTPQPGYTPQVQAAYVPEPGSAPQQAYPAQVNYTPQPGYAPQGGSAPPLQKY